MIRFWQDEVVKGILTKVAKNNTLPEAEVRSMVDHLFKNVKAEIISDNYNKIHLRNFGNFIPSKSRVDKKIRTRIAKYKEGVITKETLKEQLSKLFKIRHKLK